jgi:hypothetical protein
MSTEEFVYTPATTDITIRWRKLYNWTPPSEDPVQQRKWAAFRAQMARGVESIAPDQPQQLTRPTLIKWKTP